jgi:phosphoribosylglycinamide formyltransferase-1
MKKIVILISGRGSNMQAMLSAKLPCHIAAVISNRADAQGLDVAAQHGIATRVVSHRDYADRASFDTALAEAIDSYQPDFVVLAGFMRILTEQFVNRHQAACSISIRPLPAFQGCIRTERACRTG